MRSAWRPLNIIAALIVCEAICAAQIQVQSFNGLQSAPPAGHNRYTVTGSVVNAITGEPIRRALVRLQGPEQHSAFTGVDGRFEISNVLEGSYFPNAQRPGFFDERTRNGFMAAQGLTVSANTAPVQLKLLPESAIQGRATDQDGEPIENLQLQLLNQQLANGRKSLQPMQMASTDENGDFLLEGLQPGSYLVRSSQTPVQGFFTIPQNHGEVYPQRYYPDASDLSSAQPLAIKPGETVRADFKLSAVPAFRVSGIAGPAPNGLMVSVEDASGEQITSYGGLGPKPGHWEVPLLPSGSWTISFRTMGPPDRGEFFAQLPINVDNAEIRNLQVQLQPVPSIPVQILNPPENGGANLQLKLIPRGESQQEFYAGPEQNSPSGQLAIRGAPPGTYRVVAQSSGPFCVASVSSGGVDLSNSDLIISPGSDPAPFDVTLRFDCAEFLFQLRSSDQNTRAFVLLVSDSNVFEPRTMLLQGASSFSFGTLPPGNYRVYTLADISDLEYMNPEALRNLSAQEVTLSPNQKATVMLDPPNQGNTNAQ